MIPKDGDRPDGPASIVAQYENLRQAALGQPLPPESRCGLMLFLRRGMWGWARTLATTSVPRPLPCSRSLSFTASHEQRAVIHVFAAMAMNSDHRGATHYE
jgi:hypothetical protein